MLIYNKICIHMYTRVISITEIGMRVEWDNMAHIYDPLT